MSTNIYSAWKNVTDKLYSGELEAKKGAVQLIELLANNGTKLRGNNHQLIAVSFFVYDKDEYKNLEGKPLGLGFVYIKPDKDKTKTQDIVMVNLNGEIEVYYSEKELIKKYPWLKGVHKEKLPI
jgi:hypothetical protein